MIITFIHIIVGIFLIVSSTKLSKQNYFIPIKRKPTHYFQIAVFSLSFLFPLFAIQHTSTGCCESAHWHFGLFAIVFGWTYLISLFNKFPFVGEHSIVFFTIAWTFLKLAVFGLLLVLGSVIVLMTLFYDENAPVSKASGFFKGKDLTSCICTLAFTGISFCWIWKGHRYRGDNGFRRDRLPGCVWVFLRPEQQQ